jgi:hypothetical protein
LLRAKRRVDVRGTSPSHAIALEILLYLLAVKDHLLFQLAIELSAKKQEFQLPQKAKNDLHRALLCVL